MKPASTPSTPVRIFAYFDFMCPWSYLGRARLLHAIHSTRIPVHLTWVPFELYAHDENHRVERTSIIGHQHLKDVYAHLHPLGMREHILIFPPKYEGSSKRTLMGFLYAQKMGKEKHYMDVVYEHIFEHGQDISSFSVLRRIAERLHFDTAEFLSFIQDEKNHHHIREFTRLAKLNGVRGVPTYVINHFPVTGALETRELENILRSAHQKTIPAFLLPEKKIRKTKKKRVKMKKRRVKVKKTPQKNGKKSRFSRLSRKGTRKTSLFRFKRR